MAACGRRTKGAPSSAATGAPR